MAAKPAAAEELVSVAWCTTLGIPEDVANTLVAERWRVAGLTRDESKFEKVLEKAGCLPGDIDAAWRKWQATSGPPPAQPSANWTAPYPRSWENVRLNDPLTLRREENCEALASLLDKCGVVLVRSPPFSGKTSLASLFCWWAVNCKHKYNVYYLTLLGFSVFNTTPEAAFEDKWRCAADIRLSVPGQPLRRVSKTFNEVCASQEQTYIVVDELQLLYRYGDLPFWQVVKSALDVSTCPSRKFLLFGAYGEKVAQGLATPIAFPHGCVWGLDQLRFSEAQCDVMIERLGHADESAPLHPLPPLVRNWIINASGKHPGIVRFFIDELIEEFKRSENEKKPSTEHLLCHLMSRKVLESLASTRIIPDSTPYRDSRMLNELLVHSEVAVPMEERTIAIDLVKSGLLVLADTTDSMRVRLVCPAVKSILLVRWLRPEPELDFFNKVPQSDDFDRYIEGAIKHLDSSRLQISLAQSSLDDTLLESTWQHEFYKAMCKILPVSVSFSCDVGRVFDVNGRIDFYINTTLCWAIELAREGLKLKEHVQRFTPGGIYYAMVSGRHIRHWLVINFCADRPAEMLEHVLYVIYERPTYLRYSLLQRGRAERVIEVPPREGLSIRLQETPAPSPVAKALPPKEALRGLGTELFP